MRKEGNFELGLTVSSFELFLKLFQLFTWLVELRAKLIHKAANDEQAKKHKSNLAISELPKVLIFHLYVTPYPICVRSLNVVHLFLVRRKKGKFDFQGFM